VRAALSTTQIWSPLFQSGFPRPYGRGYEGMGYGSRRRETAD